MTLKRLILGSSGEDAAAALLKRSGYRIVERNYRCRYGEIDIIAVDRGTIAFVEVKTRTSHAFGTPAEGVDAKKQRHIAETAQYYLAEKGLEDREARFDVVGITRSGGGKQQSAELFKDAFSADLLYGD